MKKIDQIEKATAGIAIAIAMARLDDEDMVHFLPQKSAKIKRPGYTKSLLSNCVDVFHPM